MESYSNNDEWLVTPQTSSLNNQNTNERVNTSLESSSFNVFWRIVLIIYGNKRKRVKIGKSQSNIVKTIQRAGFYAEIGLSTIT